jgi:hypothetical protein
MPREDREGVPIFIQAQQGAVSRIGAQSGVGITRIDLNYGGELNQIWPAVVAPVPPTVPVNGIFELHTYFTLTSDQSTWTVFVTIVNTNNLIAPYTWKMGNSYVRATTVTDNININIGPMSMTVPTFRIKLWSTDYDTITPPPNAGATAW